MKHRVLIILTSLISSVSIHAYNISGKLVSASDDSPIEFATVVLYHECDTTKALTAKISDERGFFTFNSVTPGNYKLTVTSIGYNQLSKTNISITDSDTDLGVLQIEPNMLSEVTVLAQRPLISKEIDRIGYDVQADPEAQTASLTDMLRKVPMVSVDGEGNISIRNESFKVYKNGKPNHSFTKNSKDIFAAIPASSIKKIEVITDPAAREDAEGTGVILNIVTVDNSTIKGVLGNASLSLNSKMPIPLPRLWLTTQIGKVNLSISGGYNHQSYRSNKYSDEAEGVYHTTGNTLRTKSMTQNKSDNGWMDIEMSYDLDSLNLFTAEFGINPYSGKSRGWQETQMLSEESTVYSYNDISLQPVKKYTDLSGVFNYQHSTRRPGETLTLSYQIASTNQTNKSLKTYSDMVNMPVDYTGLESYTKLRFIEHTFQFDWVYPFNSNHKLDLGTKYIFRQNHSETTYDYTGSHSSFDNFRHRTQVAAAYFDYRMTYSRVTFRAGMRYEYSRLDAKFLDDSNPDFGSNLNDYVPNVAVMWQINDANSLRANFSTAIQRPGIGYLNPAVYESPYIVQHGNPDLESARVNNLSLKYNLINNKIYIDANIVYTFANNQLCQVRTIEGDVMHVTYDNGDRQRMFYGNAYLQYSPTDKTQISVNGTAGLGRCYSPRMGAKVSRWVYKAGVNLSQKLPWKLRGNLSFYYDDGYVNNVYQYNVYRGAGRYWYSISLQRSFLKNDRLTMRLYANNLFLPSKVYSTIYSVNSDYIGTRNNYTYNNCYFGLNVSFKFGSLRSEVKKLKTINNDDLQGKKM